MKKPSEHNKSLNEKFENFEFIPNDGTWDAIQKESESASSFLQVSFASFEFAPEKNVWDNLEKILHPQKNRRVVVWWSVAAGLAILISSTLFLSPSSLEKDFTILTIEDASTDSTKNTSNKNNKTHSTAEFVAASSLEKSITILSSEKLAINNTKSHIDSESSSSTQEIRTVDKEDIYSSDSIQHTTPPIFIKRNILNRIKNRPPHEIAINLIINPIKPVVLPFSAIIPSNSIPKPSHKKSIGTDFSSLLASSNTALSGLQSTSISEPTVYTNSGMSYSVVTTADNVEPDYINYGDEKFGIPISIGLDFSIHANHRLAILAGVNYTLLSSKASYNNADWETKYAISRNYLGIPVTLKFEWLKKKKITLYSTIGNQFDFGLKKKVRIKDFENGNEVNQSSISSKLGNQSKIISAIGVNYVLSPSFDFHFEGTLSYFYYQSHYNLWTERNFWPGLKIGITYKL